MAEIYIATGPESSGKTTLCNQLSRAARLPLVSEAARGYLEARCRLYQNYRYTQTDLLSIAMIQHAAEEITVSDGRLPVICDTDLLVIIIWSEEKFGSVDPWIINTFNTLSEKQNRHYFLCEWDIPWHADPLRENPLDRAYLYNRYLQHLENLSLPYTVLEGSPEKRLEQATKVIGQSK